MVDQLTPRQRVALEQPCARAYETADPIYWRAVGVAGARLRVTTALTVNK